MRTLKGFLNEFFDPFAISLFWGDVGRAFRWNAYSD